MKKIKQKTPALGDVLLVNASVWRLGEGGECAAIVCDVRGLDFGGDATFRVVVFRYGGSSECFDIKIRDAKKWRHKP